MMNKAFFTCLLSATCLGVNLNALDKSELDTPSFMEKKDAFMKNVYTKKATEICDQFFNTLQNLFDQMDNDIFDPQKLCNVSHLTKIKYSLKSMPDTIEKCKTTHFQQVHDLYAKMADELCSNAEGRKLFLQGIAHYDKVGKWADQYCELYKSFCQKIEEVMDFFIDNQNHYWIENKGLVFDSTDKAKKAAMLFGEISNFQALETEHCNSLLPKP